MGVSNEICGKIFIYMCLLVVVGHTQEEAQTSKTPQWHMEIYIQCNLRAIKIGGLAEARLKSLMEMSRLPSKSP